MYSSTSLIFLLPGSAGKLSETIRKQTSITFLRYENDGGNFAEPTDNNFSQISLSGFASSLPVRMGA